METTEIIEKLYEYNNTVYKILETREGHARLETDPAMLEEYLINCGEVNRQADVFSGETHTTIDTNSNTDFHWTGQTTKLLLHLFQERKEQFRNPKIKKKSLWAEMTKEFRKHNYIVNEDILDRKIRNMKKTFRTIKDNKNSTGRGRITWEYFDIFEEIYSDDKTINPGPTLSSMPLEATWSPSQDSRPPSRDSRPPSRDSRPPSRDSRPPSRDSRPPSRDSRTPIREFAVPSPDIETPDFRSPSRDSECFIDTYDNWDNLDNPLPSTSSGHSYVADSGHEPLPSKKQYSQKSGALRSKALYDIRRQMCNIEQERVEEIKQLRKTIEKSNEIQAERNKLLQSLIDKLNK